MARKPKAPVPVTIKETKEVWSTYELSDGTILRIKPVMVNLVRAFGSWAPDGQPLYNFKIGLITDVDAPEKLRRKP